MSHRTRLRVEPLDDRITPTVLPDGFTETLLTTGLTAPTAMTIAPDGRIFVTEKAGTLRVIQSGVLQPAPVLAVTADSTGERGLLGVTLDPNFARTGYVYVYYTVPASGSVPAFNRVSRFTMTGTTAGAGTEAVLLNLDGLKNANHNGGAIHFGGDGKLYVAVGENGDATNAQSLTTRLGKILRINPDGTIPADNPTTFPGASGSTAGLNRTIWAIGLRNPFTFAVRPGTNEIYVNDVGANAFDEINPGKAGANYGWPITEGAFDPAQFPGLTPPLATSSLTDEPPAGGDALAGGAFYNPTVYAFPAEFAGDYFYADFGGGWIKSRDAATGQITTFATDLTGKLPVDLAVTAQGDLLYLAFGVEAGGGGIYRVRHAQGRPLVAVGAGAGGGPVVATYDPTTGAEVNRFLAFDAAFTGGVRVATADLTGDRSPDVVAVAGPGGGPRVAVFDGVTGKRTKDFFAFEETFTGGLFVAAADFDRDGIADLILTPDVGGGPRVRIVSGKTGATIADFFAFEQTFTGGVRASAGDVNADGVPDLIVSAGAGGGPRIAVFNGQDLAAGKPEPGRLGADFFAFESTLRNGAYTAAPDLDGDGYADLTFGAGPGGGPRVLAYGGRQYATGGKIPTLVDFFAGNATDRGGVTLSATNVDGDARGDLITGPGPGGLPKATLYKVANGAAAVVRDLTAFDPSFTGGIFVG